MTITIELNPDAEERLRDKAAREGRRAEAIAAHVLANALEDEAREWAAALEGVRQGLEDSRAGRATPLEEWDAQMRAKYGIPRDVKPLTDAEADALP